MCALIKTELKVLRRCWGILTLKNNFEWIYVKALSTAHAIQVSNKILLILMQASVCAR